MNTEEQKIKKELYALLKNLNISPREFIKDYPDFYTGRSFTKTSAHRRYQRKVLETLKEKQRDLLSFYADIGAALVIENTKQKHFPPIEISRKKKTKKKGIIRKILDIPVRDRSRPVKYPNKKERRQIALIWLILLAGFLAMLADVVF